ncbi:MAG: molybdopterin molybdenumtransferase MoeA, partial [Gallionella sp.]|nr:molybdopterin molybdenumtransferase MoeA [Gallionella sp.]
MEHISVTNAQQRILECVNKLDIESVGLERSTGRVLADEVRANRDLPPYDVSAMDGYAVRSADLAKIPATLEVIEDIRAGDLPGKTVQAGQCARIMTGAPVPQGADAVIRVEDTQPSAENLVQINAAVRPGNDIRLRGEGMRNGEVVLAAGTEITPGVTGVLATVKQSRVQVYRHPRV